MGYHKPARCIFPLACPLSTSLPTISPPPFPFFPSSLTSPPARGFYSWELWAENTAERVLYPELDSRSPRGPGDQRRSHQTVPQGGERDMAREKGKGDGDRNTNWPFCPGPRAHRCGWTHATVGESFPRMAWHLMGNIMRVRRIPTWGRLSTGTRARDNPALLLSSSSSVFRRDSFRGGGNGGGGTVRFQSNWNVPLSSSSHQSARLRAGRITRPCHRARTRARPRPRVQRQPPWPKPKQDRRRLNFGPPDLRHPSGLNNTVVC